MSEYINKNFSDVQDYFRTLATLYSEIAHTEQSPKFFTSIEEVLLSKTLAGKIMICTREPSPLRGGNNDAWLRYYTAGIIIVKNVAKEAFEDMDSTFNEVENDLYEIIARLRTDCDNPQGSERPFASFRRDEIPMEWIIPVGADLWCGLKMKVTISIHLPRINQVQGTWYPES